MYSGTNRGEMPWAGEMPGLVTINGAPYWQARTGRTFPLIVAGAEDPPPTAKTEDPPKPKTGEGEGDDDFDKPRAMATIKQLRDREKTLKDQLKELDTLKADQKKRDDAEKSEADRLKEQIADLERKSAAAAQTLVETQNRIAIERAATKAGIADPDDAVSLLKEKDFERDADGNLTNAEDLVKALLKAKPYLAAQTAAAARGNTAGPKVAGSSGAYADVVKGEERKLKKSGAFSF